ncbi:MAG: FAD-dependent oxidoreductase [Candidatus Tectomicrobia bacterium]|nr:FAD-dependent oxidoreductase [Candidatus Tectomicrobia bacterium]
MEWTAEADVVIVGGGGAGLAAAVAAASEGARVIVLEKAAACGGTTALAIGSMTVAGSSMQRQAGIEDSPAAHDEDIAKFAPHLEGRNTPELRRAFLEQAAETFEWLRELGVPFRGPSPEPPNRVPRMHNAIPDARHGYIRVLHDAARRLGASLRLGRRAGRLLRSEAGDVVGVEADCADPEGHPRGERFAARCGVILAAGDFSADPILKATHLQRFAHVEAINPNSTGDGHRLGMEAGAAARNMDVLDGPQTRFVPRWSPLSGAGEPAARAAAQETTPGHGDAKIDLEVNLGCAWLRPEPALFEAGAILVNRAGERFGNELKHPDIEVAMARQPGKVAFVLFDAKLVEQFSRWPHCVCTAPNIAYAFVEDLRRHRPDFTAQGPSLEMLAARLGCPAEALVATVAAYNDAVAGRAADRHGRQSFAAPLATPPFTSLGPAKGVIGTTKGGLLVNTTMQVLRGDGRAIPGLYAAGNNGMGGIYFAGHGLAIAWAMTSGRIAGRQAALRRT